MTGALFPEAAAAPERAARWDWWDWWLDRKTRWVRDEEPQLDEAVFRALAVGTGLPPI